jgi:hypothetical protein
MADVSRRGVLKWTGATVAVGSVAGGTIAASEAQASAAVAASPLSPAAPAPTSPGLGGEPTYDQALSWWLPQRQVWTPVGWKDHLFRFDNFYNGTVVCQPAVALPTSSSSAIKPYLAEYKGRDFQVTPVLPDGGRIPALADKPYYMYRGDFGTGIQGWAEDRTTPVLWTDHRQQEGLVLRQSVFAHVTGGEPVETALEPIHAWMRFEVTHVDPLVSPDSFEFVLRLSRLMLQHYVDPPEKQEAFLTMQVTPDAGKLAGALRVGRTWNPGGKSMDVPVYDADNLVRLVCSLPAGSSYSLKEAAGHPGIYDLKLRLPVEVGSHVDVLLPMLPRAESDITAEHALGWDGALAECESFWRPNPTTASTIRTPEPAVNEFFRRSVQLAEIIAEKSPDTGRSTFLTGSFGYDLLWSTPTSMVSHMFLDLLGRHDVVADHLEVYLDIQGVRQPPGKAFENLPKDGFFATPASLQSFDWLTDHGAVLEAIARHALLSRDRAFLATWLEPIVAACDFIKRACEFQDHPGVKGIIPPAASNDTGVEQQSIWIQAWIYKGLASSVELLHREKHPRAKEFETLAKSFRAVYQDALREAAAAAPTWTDPDGDEHPVLPTKFYGPDSPWPFLEAFDTGALVSVWAGLMKASDPLMRSFVEFFRVGPNTALFDPAHHTALDRVVLDHEQSSGEPCYSWNLFHSWQRGDRAHFLEGLYGLLTGAVSPDTFISGEHRHGMYGTLFVQPLITWASRHAVIDDAIAPGEMHLLRLCPLAWLSSAQQTRFDSMPTLFGPVGLRFQLSSDQRVLKVTYARPTKERPKKTYLYPPPLPGLRSVQVNGRTYPAGRPIELKGL